MAQFQVEWGTRVDPTSGNLVIGDGTGKSLVFTKRVAGVDTVQFKFTDTGGVQFVGLVGPGFVNVDAAGNLSVGGIGSVPWADVTGTPTTLAGYGIASPLPIAQGGTAAIALPSGVVHSNGTVLSSSAVVDADITSLTFSKLLSRPTTLGGYGIMDGVSTAFTINTAAPLTGGGNFAASPLNLAVSNATGAAVGVVRLTSDLGGTGAAPTVVGLTGSAGAVAMHAATLKWDAGVLPAIQGTNTAGSNAPTFTCTAPSNTSGTGTAGGWDFVGGSTVTATVHGGDFRVFGGDPGSGGQPGTFQFFSGVTSPLLRYHMGSSVGFTWLKTDGVTAEMNLDDNRFFLQGVQAVHLNQDATALGAMVGSGMIDTTVSGTSVQSGVFNAPICTIDFADSSMWPDFQAHDNCMIHLEGWVQGHITAGNDAGFTYVLKLEGTATRIGGAITHLEYGTNGGAGTLGFLNATYTTVGNKIFLLAAQFDSTRTVTVRGRLRVFV